MSTTAFAEPPQPVQRQEHSPPIDVPHEIPLGPTYVPRSNGNWLCLAAGWESMLERYQNLTAASAMADRSSGNNKSEQAA